LEALKPLNPDWPSRRPSIWFGRVGCRRDCAKTHSPKRLGSGHWDANEPPARTARPLLDARFLPEGHRNMMVLRAEVGNKQATPNSGAGYVDLSYYTNAVKLIGN